MSALGDMIDPRDIDAIETLRDGRRIRIRAIQPSDSNGIAQAFEGMDAESIYTRFFHPKARLSQQELQVATEVDFDEIVALVATLPTGEMESIIGGGRYLVIDPHATPRRAEIAFMVEPTHRGLGIAGCLLRYLTRLAREKGVSHFEADVLPRNKAMLAVFAGCGLPMHSTEREGVVHIALAL